jgi:hypothetical protein
MTRTLLIAAALGAGVILLSLFRRGHLRIPLGAINGSYLRAPPQIDDPRIGRSRGLPFALEFRIGEGETGFPGGIGRVVHRALFPGAPDFAVHIKFACARPGLLGQSDFANPASIWYNVFVGYYQVEVDQEAWGRPFGYDLDAEGHGELRLEEIARLVRADWDHISNELYGVPARAIAAMNARGREAFEHEYQGRVRKEGWDGAFDLAEFRNLQVIGPHSARGGADYVNLGALVGPLWRRAFGTHPAALGVESFLACRLRMRAYFCFKPARSRAGRPVYHTFVFGGSIHSGHDGVDAAENARFLDLQMDELERIIAGERGIGFTDPARPARSARPS